MNSQDAVLQTQRLTLRPIVAEDQAHIFKGLSHPQVIPYYGVSFATFEATKEQMDWYANLVDTQTGIWWAVLDRETGAFLGAGGYNDWSQEHRKAEIGFWLLPEHWGKGVMQEGMGAIMDHGFREMRLHRIEGYVVAGNENCKRGLAKMAFHHEGTMRDCEVKDGAFISVDIFAAFAPQNEG
ncbi:MAG: GNAT family N-acetyltransferase [Bacteroidota bacterium]